MDDEKAELILQEDAPDQEHYEEITDAERTGGSRWSTFFSQVWRDTRDGTFWKITWSRGSTEYQDEGVEHVQVAQVWPHQVMQTVYRTKPQEE